MKKKNGFTLVELLAVIVILAVVVLIAMTAVVPQMEKARKNAFITEANKFLQGATNYYTDAQIKSSGSSMPAAGGCVSIQTLITGGYIDKKAGTNYHGYVNINASNPSSVTYSIILSNGNYHTGSTAGTPAEISPANLNDTNIQTNSAQAADAPSGVTCYN